jgi:hypothetical protein
LQRREKGQKEKRERVAVAAWWLCWLPVVELVFVVVYRLGLLVFSLEKAAVERWRELQKADGKRRKMETGGAGFFVIFGPHFLLSEVINGASIYRRWKRVISSTPG